MEKSIEKILDGLKHCKKPKCDGCPYEKQTTYSCNRVLLEDCAEMLLFQAEIIKDMDTEQNRLKAEISALQNINDILKNDIDDENKIFN